MEAIDDTHTDDHIPHNLRLVRTRPRTGTRRMHRRHARYLPRVQGEDDARPEQVTMSANADFHAELLEILKLHEAIRDALSDRLRRTAITVRNDAMMSVEMMFEAEHAECKRLRAQLEEVTR